MLSVRRLLHPFTVTAANGGAVVSVSITEFCAGASPEKKATSRRSSRWEVALYAISRFVLAFFTFYMMPNAAMAGCDLQ